MCVYAGSGHNQIGLGYIHFQFVKQMLNEFGLDLNNWIKNFLPYLSNRTGFGLRSDPLTNLRI